MQLLTKSEGEGNGLGGSVEVGRLMRVLAVAEALFQVVLQEKFLGQTSLFAHVGSDAAVVLGGMGVGLGRQFEACLLRGVAMLANLSDHRFVIGGVAHDGHVAPVLGGTAHHGGTSNVDILDGLFEGNTLFGNRLAEGVEVYAHHVNLLDSVLFESLEVFGKVAAGEDAAMHVGMEGLHTAIENLRESGHLANADGFDIIFLKKTACASCGDDFPAHLLQGLHKRYQSSFVANAY